MPFEASQGGFLVSDDPERIDAGAVHAYLARSYWAEGIPLGTVERSIENSIPFGVYDEGRGHAQVGFARVITDRATFAYVGDVYVLEEYRGRGLSKFLMERIKAHPDLQGLRRWMLVTRDAHELYKQFGFGPLDNPTSVMQIRDREVYRKQSGRAAEQQNSRPREGGQVG